MGESLTTAIISIISGVDLLGLLAFFLYYRQNKKSKELDNDSKDIDNIDKTVDTTNKIIEILEDKFNDSEEDSKQKKAEIEKLQQEKEEAIKQKFDLMQENTELKLKCMKAEFIRCECLDCQKRIPPLYDSTKINNDSKN